MKNCNLYLPTNSTYIVDAAYNKKKHTYKPFTEPSHIEILYVNQLESVFDAYEHDVRKILVYLKQKQKKYTTDSWADVLMQYFDSIKKKYDSKKFSISSLAIADKFVNLVNNYNIKKSQTSFGVNAYKESGVRNFLKLQIHENVNLIKSIPQQNLEKVEQIVYKSIMMGQSYETLAKQIEQQFAVGRKRARFIAINETSKINGQLTARRQQNAGIELFRWHTVNDEKVRHAHKILQNKKTEYGIGIYKWSDLPVNPDTNEETMPSLEYGCRCLAEPIIEGVDI